MWKNLKDVRSMAEKVAAVVAPPAEDGEYEDEEYEDGEYEDEEYEEYSEEDEDNVAAQPKSPFGMVGNLLARAIDNEEQQQQQHLDGSHSNETNEEEQVAFFPNEDAHGVSPQSSESQDNDYHNDNSAGGGETGGEIQQHNTAVFSSSFTQTLEAGQHDRGTVDREESGNTFATPERDKTETFNSPKKVEQSPIIEEPARYGLVRESGSLTPRRNSATTPKKVSAAAVNPTLVDTLLGVAPEAAGGDEAPANEENVAARQLPSIALGSMHEDDDDEPHEEKETAAATVEIQVLPEQQPESTNRAVEESVAPAPEKKKKLPSYSTHSIDSPMMAAAAAASSASSASSALNENGGSTSSLNTHASSSATKGETSAPRIEKLEKRCKELKRQLGNAENLVLELQQQTASRINQQEDIAHHSTNGTGGSDNGADHEQLMLQFQAKEARLLQAAAENHEQEMQMLRNEMDEKISSMQQQLMEERNASQQNHSQMDGLLTEALARAEAIEKQAEQAARAGERSSSQIQQQQARALRMAEDKLAQTLALLSEREENVQQLKGTVKTLESTMTEQHEGVQEAEEEMDELHTENEALHNQVESLESEKAELRKKVTKLEADSEKLVHLKMELRMMKEDHSRVQAKVQNVAASAESSTAQLESERDEALSTVHDLQHQLSAALADVQVSKADTERIMTANGNLQAALEVFQTEREAELAMIEEQRLGQEEATAAVHAAALDATHEAHNAEIRQMQQASNAALENSQNEIKLLEEKLERFRLENVQTRRSLDEAINRLQATQDDVIDRTFMKNILLDWLTKTEMKERKQVLELMASVLHFTDDEKEKVHLDDGGGLRKLILAPPPPSKVDLEHLDGDNVREKWVNFLIGEAED